MRQREGLRLWLGLHNREEERKEGKRNKKAHIRRGLLKNDRKGVRTTRILG